MKALCIILVALPVIAMQAIGIYLNAVTPTVEQTETKAKQAALDRIATPLTRECLRMKQGRPSPWDVDKQK